MGRSARSFREGAAEVFRGGTAAEEFWGEGGGGGDPGRRTAEELVGGRDG